MYIGTNSHTLVHVTHTETLLMEKRPPKKGRTLNSGERIDLPVFRLSALAFILAAVAPGALNG